MPIEPEKIEIFLRSLRKDDVLNLCHDRDKYQREARGVASAAQKRALR